MTRATTYTPGTWFAAVAPTGAVVLDAAAAPALVARLWDALADAAGLHGMLDVLTAGHAGAFSTLPPFAIVLREDGATRIAVRGAVTVTVDGGPTLSGAGVTTWSEQLVPGDGAVRVTTPRSPAGGADLTVRDGIVLASVVDLRWDASGSSMETAGSAPAEDVLDPAGVPGAAPVAAVEPEVVLVSEPEPVLSEPGRESEPVLVSEPVREPEPQPVLEPEPVSEPQPASEPQPVSEGVAVPAPIVADPPRSADPLGDGWLVDSIPAFGTPIAHPGPDPDADFDASEIADTRVVRGDDEALTRDPFEAAPVPDDVVVEQRGDHDGETISLAQARALREVAGRQGDTVPPLAPPRMPAPGRLRLSTGVIVPLDRTVVIGRRPRSTRVSGTDLPRLIAVDSPQQDISRSHLELRVEGDTIVATDLQTTNGTLLLRAGTSPTRLHPGEPTVVVPGDVLDLGDEITVGVEELA